VWRVEARLDAPPEMLCSKGKSHVAWRPYTLGTVLRRTEGIRAKLRAGGLGNLSLKCQRDIPSRSAKKAARDKYLCWSFSGDVEEGRAPRLFRWPRLILNRLHVQGARRLCGGSRHVSMRHPKCCAAKKKPLAWRPYTLGTVLHRTEGIHANMRAICVDSGWAGGQRLGKNTIQRR